VTFALDMPLAPELAIFALALLVLIVWWTWPKKPRDGGRDE